MTLHRRDFLRGAAGAALALPWLEITSRKASAAELPAAFLRLCVGHLIGIAVLTPTGRCLVYDAGRLGAPGAARRALAGVLWSAGLSRIDTLVISHADADHFNAVPELLDRFVVGRIVVPRPFLASPSPRMMALDDL